MPWRTALLACCLAVLAGCVTPGGQGRNTPAPVGASAGDDAEDITGAVVQLQGYRDDGLDELADGTHRLAVVDLARDAAASYFSADEIGRLKRSGKKVLAYFEIGSLEWFRPDYPALRDRHPDLFLDEWTEWPGEYFVKYWQERWWQEAVRPRVDRALAAGFDGVYLDSVVAYEEIAPERVPGLSTEELGARMVALIRRISAYAKRVDPGFWVFPQNAPELRRHPGYLAAVDGIGMEELFYRATDLPCDLDYCAPNLAGARALRRAGKVVVAIDYANRPENIADACRRYREEGFAGYVTVRDLDVVSPPCP
ncbi:glycoside hydrolase [Streptomyces sp. SID8111]|uniref:endo alpha-1,4 polygalactosaminidase n=1 Tax=Streptomyces sp. SID8111 TaxID=2706100 RepID=UPI0013BF90C1|nr:endo alpha-1,4 polygalactosaminidase [Streptomyces sp. SID8111]NEC30067.1 glycoside hydrolase [Streptomyces sp. SID8111]